MYKFGKTSTTRLESCDVRLQLLMKEVIKYIDFSVIDGHRSQELQDKYYDAGKTQVKWPNSKHNVFPSRAVDVAPYPIDWNDNVRFAYLVGIIMGVASQMGIEVRCGIDWDRDGDIRDHTFLDFPHIELLDWYTITRYYKGMVKKNDKKATI